MSKVKIQGNASGTGVITLTAPNTNTDRTITLPDGDITLGGGIEHTVSASDPTISSNPTSVGHLWINSTSGEQFIATDVTAGANVWANTGAGVDGVSPPVVLTLNGVVQSNFEEGTNVTVTSQGFYVIQSSVNITVNVKLWGAAGGSGPRSASPTSGAAGGYTTGTVSLLANTEYLLIVGQGGFGGSSQSISAFPDGGAADTSYPEGGGGGSSRFSAKGSITNTAASYNNTALTYLLIAGGGSGGGDNHTAGTAGGWGGGTSGQNGGRYYPNDGSSCLGGGGTQAAGGAAGTGGREGTASVAGAKYSGGFGSCGGGGGYYGGGGSRGYYAQAGGGSGYIDSSVTSGSFLTTNAANYNIAPGTPPSNAGSGVTTAQAQGNDGAAVISFVSKG